MSERRQTLKQFKSHLAMLHRGIRRATTIWEPHLYGAQVVKIQKEYRRNRTK